MTKIIFAFIFIALLNPANADTCGNMFAPSVSSKPKPLLQNSREQMTAYAEPISQHNSGRPLYVNLRKDGRRLKLTYGDLVYGGYQTRLLTLAKEEKTRDAIIRTYVYLRNGVEYIRLISSENQSGRTTISYKLFLKSEITTPSSSERAFQFTTEL